MDAKVIMEKCPPRERLVLPEGCSRPYFYIFILGSLIMGRVLAIDRSLKVCYDRTLANLEGASGCVDNMALTQPSIAIFRRPARPLYQLCSAEC